MSEGICGSGISNPLWNCVEHTQGAAVLAALYNLSDNGQLSSSSASGIVANVVSYGFTVATLTCQQSFIASQTVSLNCDNSVLGDIVSNNPNCLDCKIKMQSIIDMRTKLETDANQLNPSYQIQQASQSNINQFNGENPNHNDGICQYVCLQCIAKDIEQTLQMTIDASCQTNTSSFITAFTSGMS